MGKKYKTEEERKEARRLYNKKWYEENKEKVRKRHKKYRQNNKEKIRERDRKYREKEKVRKNRNKRIRERFKNDQLFRLKRAIRSSVTNSIKSVDGYKSKRTEEILGCSFKELKQHIESQWEDWMSWDNYGLYNGELNHGWDIDHIEPLSLCESEEDVYKLNHYTNLQPLCSYTNRYIKRDNIN
jgi:hypothetical protein